MRDRLNRLEKLGYLDVDNWLAWREVRNRLAHEYPDQPELRFAALRKPGNMTLQTCLIGLGYAPVIRTFDQVPTANPACTGDAPDPASSNAPYRIYNIGNQQPVELLRYIEVLEQCLGRKAQMQLLPREMCQIPRRTCLS